LTADAAPGHCRQRYSATVGYFMRPEALTDALEWLRYADEDLASCVVLLHSPRALLGTASYHAQQAAEKALKAFLVAREQPLIRTHDVGVLVARCENIDDSFAPFTAAAARLTPYAVMHRYPQSLGPSRDRRCRADSRRCHHHSAVRSHEIGRE
jgi:HEPN domain-containing protein